MSSPKVLVVDDEDLFRLSLIRQLKTDGLEADGAATGEEALVILEKNKFDVVLLDVRMPGLTGVGVMMEIQRRSIPVEVIFLTGHASVDDALAGMRYGAVDYLLKPYSKERLLNKIMEAYGRKKKKVTIM